MSTIKLTAAQWRDMVLGNLNRVASYAQIQDKLGPIDAAAMQKSLTETASFIGAWALASTPPEAQVLHEGVKAHENGAAQVQEPTVRRRGGRPKGSRNKPKETAEREMT